MLGLLTLAKTRPHCCVTVYFWSYEIAVMADQSTYLVWQKWGWISKWYSSFQQIKTAGFYAMLHSRIPSEGNLFLCNTDNSSVMPVQTWREMRSFNHTGREFDLRDDHGAEELLPANLGSEFQLVLEVLPRHQLIITKSKSIYQNPDRRRFSCSLLLPNLEVGRQLVCAAIQDSSCP